MESRMNGLRRRWLRLSKRTRLNILTVFWAIEIVGKLFGGVLLLWTFGLFWLPL